MLKWPALIAAIVIVPSLAWSGDDRMVVKKTAHSVAATRIGYPRCSRQEASQL